MPPKKRSQVLRTIEDVPVVASDEFHQVSHEETELSDFLDGLGPEVSEIHLYQILPTGKKVFRSSGHPSLFSEQAVQLRFGAGDFQARGKLNGKWHGAKNFSVAEPIGTTANGTGPSSELDRIKSDLEAQRIRLEQQQLKLETDRREQEARLEMDRREREQRAHELQLEMLRSVANHGNNGNNNMNIADIIGAVRSLKEMGSGQDEIYKAIDRAFDLAGKLKDVHGEANPNGESGDWWSWTKPVLTEAGKQLLPRFLPFLNNAIPPAGMPMPAMPPTMQPTAPFIPAPTTPTAAVTPAADAATPQEGQGGQPQPQTSSTPTEEQQQAEFLVQKRGALGLALTMARMNRPAEFYADLVIEQVEAGNDAVAVRIIKEIQTAASFESWFAELEKLDATIITQRLWFEVFFNSVRETINAKLEEES